MSVRIVRTGCANVASVRAAFRRLGVATELVSTPEDVGTAERLVLPGVGSFGAVRAVLDELGLVEALSERLDAGRPTLAICLGFQLLGASSEESPSARGLDLYPLAATRFAGSERVPQIGWNRVVPDGPGDPGRCVQAGYAYFANSYRFTQVPAGWSAAWSDHGGPFVAALERGAVVGCQFHPELSGASGRALLERWLEKAGVAC